MNLGGQGQDGPEVSHRPFLVTFGGNFQLVLGNKSPALKIAQLDH